MTLFSKTTSQPSFPEAYESRLVGPLFRPWAEMTLEELDLSPGDRVLDIACGTGIVARVAGERLGADGYVVGVDVSPDMLSVARVVAPGIDWREGAASALPLRQGEQFDVVVCQQGLQFFPDRMAAAAQMRRALTIGGRLAVSTWRSDEEMPFLRELRSLAERRLGPITDMRHSLGDAATIETLLQDAGFEDVCSRTVTRTIRFDNDLSFFRLNTMALVGMSAAGKELSDEERKRVVDEIVSESENAMSSYIEGSGLAFELSSNLATANG